LTAVEHEPSVHPAGEKAEDEDENENEDDGCRQDCVPAANDRLFRAEAQRRRGRHRRRKAQA